MTSAPTFRPNDIVQHFKREKYFKEHPEHLHNPQFKNMYLYKIIDTGINTETHEKMMIYQAMYGDFTIWIRPYDMFISKVNKEKYPDITQKYRFEVVKHY